jgi:hypothetical protein
MIIANLAEPAVVIDSDDGLFGHQDDQIRIAPL